MSKKTLLLAQFDGVKGPAVEVHFLLQDYTREHMTDHKEDRLEIKL